MKYFFFMMACFVALILIGYAGSYVLNKPDEPKEKSSIKMELPDGWEGKEYFKLESIDINYISPPLRDNSPDLVFGVPVIELTNDTLMFKIPWKYK